MIAWSQTLDGYTKGISSQGQWWIKQTRDNKVSGLYLIQDDGEDVMKFTAADELPENLEEAKVYANILHDQFVFAQEIVKKEEKLRA